MASRYYAIAATALVCVIPTPSETTSLRATAAGQQSPCGGAPIKPTKVISGSFGPAQQGSYVYVPFDVPAGTTAVRVKYCFDKPELPSAGQLNHTIDLGLYEPLKAGDTVYGPREFRGWGGSSHPDVIVSREGFGAESVYLADPKRNTPGKTTRGFRPGPVRPGRWAAELGVAAVIPQSQGDADGKVAWRVEVELARDPAFADEPYRPAPYDSRPARRGPGWYAGDFHVHGEHSALGDATMSEIFDYAFGPLAQQKAGLDFITLSDYVAGASWDEIGRYQPRYPGKLIIPSTEIITYRGHANAHATTRTVDYRTGPLYLRRDDGTLERVRGGRPPRELLHDIQAGGGFTQINHPTIFPSDVPGFASLCRGCPWDYGAAETNYADVDAIEVITGPATVGPDAVPNPFVLSAIDFYERALAAGHKIAAVGSSDSHNAGRVKNALTQTPVGRPTTVVYADELSERGIQRAVEAGHSYVKFFGNSGPDLRFEARVPGSRRPVAIMGDTVDAPLVRFSARVLGAGDAPRTLQVVKNGSVVSTAPVGTAESRLDLDSTGPGRYRLQLMRGSSVEAVSSPIYVGPREPLAVAGFTARRPAVRRGYFATLCRVTGTDARRCVVEARIARRGRLRRIGVTGVPLTGDRASVRVRLGAAGRLLVARAGRRGLRATLVFRGVDREGREVSSRRRATLVARR